MGVPRFLSPTALSPQLAGRTIELDANAAHHATRVLRSAAMRRNRRMQLREHLSATWTDIRHGIRSLAREPVAQEQGEGVPLRPVARGLSGPRGERS